MAPPNLQQQLNHIQERIHLAAERSHRPASGIRLVTVTKNVKADRINQAIQLGLHELGENRVQEATLKRDHLLASSAKPVVHHLIGSLQTNKARKAVELFELIQSVDRPKLAQVLNRVAGEMGKKQECLIEVKISSEQTKHGVLLDELQALIQYFEDLPHLSLKGLMTIAPFEAGESETRRCFQQCKAMFDHHQGSFGENSILSMGMTDDFEWAIEEGSTMVRLGRALFGERR